VNHVLLGNQSYASSVRPIHPANLRNPKPPEMPSWCATVRSPDSDMNSAPQRLVECGAAEQALLVGAPVEAGNGLRGEVAAGK
jgi:hypothetical protein